MTEYRKQPMTPYERLQKQKLHRLRIEAIVSHRRAEEQYQEIKRQMDAAFYEEMRKISNEAIQPKAPPMPHMQ